MKAKRTSIFRKVRFAIASAFAVIVAAVIVTSYVTINATSSWKSTEKDGTNDITVEQKYFETDSSGNLKLFTIQERSGATTAPYMEEVESSSGSPKLKDRVPLQFMIFSSFDTTNYTASFDGIDMNLLSSSVTVNESNDPDVNPYPYKSLDIPDYIYHKVEVSPGVFGVKRFAVTSVRSTTVDLAVKYGLVAVRIPDTVTKVSPAALYGCYKLEYLESSLVGNTIDDGSLVTYDEIDGSERTRTIEELKSETLGSMFFIDQYSTLNTFPEVDISGNWPKDVGNKKFNTIVTLDQTPEPIFDNNDNTFNNYVLYDRKNGTSTTTNEDLVAPAWYYEYPVDIITANGAMYAVPKSLKYVKITKEEGLVVRAFYNWRNLEEVWLPNSCRNLSGAYTFYRNTNLKHITLPKTASTVIGTGFFGECNNLEEVTLPLNLETISEGLFFKCENLKTVDIPSTVKIIGNGAFAYCAELENYRIYSTVPGDISKLSSGFNLPQTVQKIGVSAFLNNQKIETVDIPSTLNEIGSCAFQACIGITRMSIPFVGKTRGAGKTASEEQLFGYIFGSGSQGWIMGSETPTGSGSPTNTDSNILTKVYTAKENFGSGIISFAIPSSLKTLDIKDETAILTGGLQSLVSLNTLTINEGCASIALGALGTLTNSNGDAPQLKEVSVPNLGAHNTFGSLFGVNQYTGSYPAANQNGQTYHIPSTLEKITLSHQASVPAWAFSNIQVQVVEIGDYTTWMDNCVFHGNNYLRSLTLPFVGMKRGEADRYVGSWYYGVWYPNWYSRWWPTVLSEDVFFRIFSYSATRNEYYREQYRNVPKDSFNWYGRYIPQSLTELIITDDTVINGYTLDNISSIQKLEIRKASYISWGACQGMPNLTEVILPFVGCNINSNTIHNSEHVFGWFLGTSSGSGFYNAYEYANYSIPSGLKKITINSTDTITNYAFANLTSVERITLGTRVSLMGAYAFANDSKLEDLNYNNSADYNYVNDYAFYGCRLLNNNNFYRIIESENVTGVGAYSFANTSVRSDLPSSLGSLTASKEDYVIDFSKLTTIGAYAFSGSAGISYAEVPSTVARLGEGAFANCPFLTYARLSENKVSANLFKDCIRLNNLDLRGVTTTIPAGMFNGCKSLVIVEAPAYDSVSPEWAVDRGVILAEETTAFGDYAFANCSSLVEFPFPSSLTTIGNYVFANCGNLLPMTLPTKVVNIGQHSWDNVRTPQQPEYYFWVYYRETEWPKGWKENWNCYWPVFIIGDTSEYMFTYEYNKDLGGYLITGTEKNVLLPEFLTFPSKHHGLPVVGIINDDWNSKTKINGIEDQTNVKKVIIPSSYKLMANDIFGPAVEIYTELTKAQILDRIKKFSKTGPDSIANYDISPITNIDEVLMWAPNPGSAIFTKEYWEYGKTEATKNIPYIYLSSLTYELELTYGDDVAEKYIYDGTPKTPTIAAAILPGIHGPSYNKLLYCNTNDGSYTIGEQEYSPIFLKDTPVFKLSYENNVLAGTATAIVELSNISYEFDEFFQYPSINPENSDTNYIPYHADEKLMFEDGIIGTPYNVYNTYIRRSNEVNLYDMFFTGNCRINYTINKKNITLFPHVSSYITLENPLGFTSWDSVEYTGNVWRFSNWDSSNVQWGNEGTISSLFTFAGSISTTSRNVKLITDRVDIDGDEYSTYNGGYYVSQKYVSTNSTKTLQKTLPADIVVDNGWKVYDATGRDVTNNFTVELGYVRVKIVPMKVTLQWLDSYGENAATWNNGGYANQDVYWDSSFNGGQMKNYPEGIDNGFAKWVQTSVLLYPYLAKDILPQAKVIRCSSSDNNLNGQEVNDSRLKIAYDYKNNGTSHPDVTAGTTSITKSYYNDEFMIPNYYENMPYNGGTSKYNPGTNLVASAWLTETDGRHNYDLLYYDGTALDQLDNNNYDRWGKQHNPNEGTLGQIIYQGYYITKGKIEVKVINPGWVIGINDNYWSANLKQASNYPYISIRGLGENSRIEGQLSSFILDQNGYPYEHSNAKGVYTLDGVDGASEKLAIRWEGDFSSGSLIELGKVVDGKNTHHYGIYNERKNSSNNEIGYENEYYDEIDLYANLVLLYNNFITDFRIDGEIYSTYENSIGNVAKEVGIFIDYHTKGLMHVFTATDSETRPADKRIFDGLTHDSETTVTYLYTKETSYEGTTAFDFLELNEYRVGVRFERKNFDTAFYSVTINVLPTDVIFNSTLSKIYDGNPLMIVGDVILEYNSLITRTQDQNGDNVVNKTDAMLAYYSHAKNVDGTYSFLDKDGFVTTNPSEYVVSQTGIQTITYVYYDVNNKVLTSAPVDVGTYWVEVDVKYNTPGSYGQTQFFSSDKTPEPPERERFFNEYSGKFAFRILPRPITIDLSCQFVDISGVTRQTEKYYDKSAVEIQFADGYNSNMIVAGSLIGDDIFTGTMFTSSNNNKTAEPGTYGNGSWSWYGATSSNPGWQVINKNSPFKNNTSNYEVKFINNFKIKELKFGVTASDNTVPYDGLYHSINFTVSDPIENATIIFKNDAGNRIERTFVFGSTTTLQQLADSIIPKYVNVKSTGISYSDREDYYTISYELKASHYETMTGTCRLTITWLAPILSFEYSSEGVNPTVSNYFYHKSENDANNNAYFEDITITYVYDGLPHSYAITSYLKQPDNTYAPVNNIRYNFKDENGNVIKGASGPVTFTKIGVYDIEFYSTNRNYVPLDKYMYYLYNYNTYSQSANSLVGMGGSAQGRYAKIHIRIVESNQQAAVGKSVSLNTVYNATYDSTTGSFIPTEHSLRIYKGQTFNTSDYNYSTIASSPYGTYYKINAPMNNHVEFYLDENTSLGSYATTAFGGIKVEYSVDGGAWEEYDFDPTKALEMEQKLPKFSDAGTHIIEIRVLGKGFAPLVLRAELTIEEATFDSFVSDYGLKIEDYVGYYDAKYHSVEVTNNSSSNVTTDELFKDKIEKFEIQYTTNVDANIYQIDDGFTSVKPEHKDVCKERYYIRLKAPNYKSYYFYDPIYAARPSVNFLSDTAAEIETKLKNNGYNYVGDIEIKQVQLYGIIEWEYNQIQFTKAPLDNASIKVTDILEADNNTLTTEKIIVDRSFDKSLGKDDAQNERILTIHDGAYFAYYYELEIEKDVYGADIIDSSGKPQFKYDSNDNLIKTPIAAPTELGYYYVEMKFLNSTNCKPMTVYGIVQIVPKVLKVEYTEEVEYLGVIQDPLPYVITGTDDEIIIIDNLDVAASGGKTEAIDIGTYYYDLEMYMVSGEAKNYVLDTYRIEFNIVKRKLHIVMTDIVHDYDMNKWTLYTDDFATSEYGKYLDGTLLNDHMLRVSMETRSYVAMKYVYDSNNPIQPSNRVNILDTKVYYMSDTDPQVEVDVSDFYEITFEVIVSIVYPKLVIEENTLRIKYDGKFHTLNISNFIPSYVRGWTAFYSTSDTALLKDYLPYNPLSEKDVGEYPLYVYLSASMYDPDYYTFKLIIEPADLVVQIKKIDNDADNDFSLMFNGRDNQVEYDLVGIVPGEEDIVKTHLVYIPFEDYTYFELDEYLKENIDDFVELENYKESLYDYGKYWAVVYLTNKDAENKNYTSAYGIQEVEITRRPITVTFPGSFHAIETWDNKKFSYPLGNSTIDTASILNDGKDILHYVYNKKVHEDSVLLANYILTSTVRTNNSDAGVYYGNTDFEFDEFIIWSEDKGRNVAQNYYPVIVPDFSVTIEKAYLDENTFKVTTPYVKDYDGLANIPPIETLSDGIITYEFFGYDESTDTYSIPLGTYYSNSVITLPKFTLAGKYKVFITIAEGTNHYAYPQPTDSAYPAVEAEVECRKLALRVYWEDLEVDFNAEFQKPKAYFVATDGTKKYTDVEFYDVTTGTVSYSKLNAGKYNVEAVISDPVDSQNYRLFEEDDRLTLLRDGKITVEEYYEIELKDAVFTINKLKLIIPIGDIVVDSSSRWSRSFDTDIFKGQDAYNLITSKKLHFYNSDTSGKAVIRTYHGNIDDDYITPLPGVYSQIEQFELDITITTDANPLLGISAYRITDSFEFDVDGSVTLESKDIIFNYTKRVVTTYNADYVRPSDYITVTQPKGKSTNVRTNGIVQIEYSMDECETWTTTEPKIIDVGVYRVYFRMFDNSSEYSQDAKYNSTAEVLMEIEIQQKEAYMQFMQKGLDKVYDDKPVNKTTVSLLGGYNGNTSDIVLKMYQGSTILYDGLGNATNEMTTDPIDVGTYVVVVTSKADDDPSIIKNYTTLYVEHTFEIKRRTIRLDLDLDYQSIAFGTAKYTTTDTLIPGTGFNSIDNTGLCQYDKLDYKVESYDPIQRGTYHYLLNQVLASATGIELYTQPVGITGATASGPGTGNPDFIYTYNIYSTHRTDAVTSAPLDVTNNYVIDLDLELVAHYPYIRAKIDNVNASYDGNMHYGTLALTSKPGAILTGSSYSEGTYTLNDPSYRLNLSDMRVTYSTKYVKPTFAANGGLNPDPEYTSTPIGRVDPGTSRIYYRVESLTDPHELLEGSFLINISKLTRTVTLPELEDMVFQNKPYGYQDLPSKYTIDGTDYYYYLPCAWADISITGKSGVPDAYDRSQISVYYRKSNSNKNLNEAIDAAEYTVYLEIPESEFYKKSVTKATFRINQAVIYIRDTATPLEVGFNGSSVSFSTFDGLTNMYATVNESSTSQDMTYHGMNLTIEGVLSTTGSAIGRYKQGSDVGGLVWTSVASAYSGDSKKFFIYDNILTDTTTNLIDVSENFVLDIKDASIFIKGSDMVVQETSQEVVYTGSQIAPNFKVLLPSLSQISRISYREVLPDENTSILPNIDVYDANWKRDVTLHQFSPINVGEYKFWVLLEAPNYNKYVFLYTTKIVKNNLKITIPDQSKEYDAMEVLEPINFYPNTPAHETVDRSKYTITYTEWDPIDHRWIPVVKYDRPINVGRYKIEVQVPDSPNFNGGIFEREFTISPRRIILTNASWDKTQFVYNSDTQIPKLVNIPLPQRENVATFNADLNYTVTQITGGDKDSVKVGAYRVDVEIDNPNYTLAGLSSLPYYIIQKEIIIQIEGTFFQNSYYEFYQHGQVDPSSPTNPNITIINTRQATYTFNVFPNLSSNDYTIDTSVGLEGSDHFVTKLVLIDTKVGPHTRYTGTNTGDFLWYDGSTDITQAGFVDGSGKRSGPIINRNTGSTLIEDVTSNYRIGYRLNLMLDFNTTNLTIDSYVGYYDGANHGIDFTVGNTNAYTVSYSTVSKNGPWTQLPMVAKSPTDPTLIPDKTYLPQYTDVMRNPDGSVGFYPIFLKVEVSGLSEKVGEGSVTIYPYDPGLAFKNPNELVDKVYDAVPYANPDVVFKSAGVTSSPIFDYYKLEWNTTTLQYDELYLGSDVRPTDVGDYKLKVHVASGDNFNNAEIEREFKITKRQLILHINEGRKVTVKYSGNVWSTEVHNSDFSDIYVNTIKVSGIAPGDVSTAAVRSTTTSGTTFTPIPNVYQTKSADVKLVLNSADSKYYVEPYSIPSEFQWKNGKFYVYRGVENPDGSITLATTGIGSNKSLIETTDNYDLTVYAEVEIQKGTINFEVKDYEGIYDGNNATVTVNVLEPLNGYQILYATDPILGPWSTTPVSRSDIGVTTAYVRIVAPNYEEAYDSGTITIKAIPIPINGGDNPPTSYKSGMALTLKYEDPDNPGNFIQAKMKFDTTTNTWTNRTKLPSDATNIQYTLSPYVFGNIKAYKENTLTTDISDKMQTYTFASGPTTTSFNVYGAIIQPDSTYALDSSMTPAGEYTIKLERLLPTGPQTSSDSINIKLYYTDNSGVKQESILGYDSSNSTFTTNDPIPNYVTQVEYTIDDNFPAGDVFSSANGDKVEDVTNVPFVTLNVNSGTNNKTLSTTSLETTVDLLLTRGATSSTKPYKLVIKKGEPSNPHPNDPDPTAVQLEVIYDVLVGGSLSQVTVPLLYDKTNKKWYNDPATPIPSSVGYVKVKFEQYPSSVGGNNVEIYRNIVDSNGSPTVNKINLSTFTQQDLDLSTTTTTFNYDIYKVGDATPGKYKLEITKDVDTTTPNLDYEKNYVYNGKPYMSDTSVYPLGRPRYNTISTGTQTIKYYLPTDLSTPIAGDGEALSAPIDAGDYVLVIDVAADGTYPQATITQTFTIKKKEVNVEWDKLSQVYDGNLLVPTAKITLIDNTKVALAVSGSQTNVGEYNAANSMQAVASIDAAISGADVKLNYQLTSSTYKSDWEITRKKIVLPELDEDTFEYLDKIVFKAKTGDIYEMDQFGNITSWTKPNGSQGTVTELDFKIIPSTDSNPDDFFDIIDGTSTTPTTVSTTQYVDPTGTTTYPLKHEFKVVLKDKDNTMWSNIADSDTDANKTKDVPYTYHITAKDLSDPTKYEIIVTYDDPQTHTGKAIEPVTKVEYKDLSTGAVKEIIIYKSTASPVGGSPTTNITTAGCIVSYKDNVNVTRPYSNDPTDTSIPAEAQIIIDGYHFFKFNDTNNGFGIKASKPTTLVLKDDSTYEFMQATFDTSVNMAYISEDHIGFERKTAKQADVFLGHILEETPLQDALKEFENDIECLRVLDNNGNIVEPTRYDEFIGTNFTIELYDTKEDALDYADTTLVPLDSIKVLIFGDLNGDGFIDGGDGARMVELIADESNSTVYGDDKLYWFAACVGKIYATPDATDHTVEVVVDGGAASIMIEHLATSSNPDGLRINEIYDTKTTTGSES